jgi:hypothetical protein
MADFTDSEKTGLLFKKFLGKPSTDSDLRFFAEPSLPARPNVFTTQIWSEAVPATRPTGDWNGDTLANFISGASAGQTVDHDTYSVQYVHQQVMIKVTNGNSRCYKAEPSGTNLLEKAIPFNYDSAGGYAVTLNRRTASAVGAQIFDGVGEWVIDPDAGTLTFYQYTTVQSYVTEFNPPFLSFFRYTGATGLSAGGQWTAVSDGIAYSTSDKTVLVGKTTATAPAGTYDFEVNGAAKFGSIVCPDLGSGSDRRLKSQIRVVPNPLQRLAGLQGVDFVWRGNGKRSTGVIAQDVQAVQPWSVSIMDTKNKFLCVKYNDLVGLLVAGVNAQQKMIAWQKGLVTRQGENIIVLSNQVKALQESDKRTQAQLLLLQEQVAALAVITENAHDLSPFLQLEVKN